MITKPVSEEEVHNALRSIVNNSNEGALKWCVNYANRGLHMDGEELRTQCLYVLNNMTRWRGAEAKEVRQILKEYIK